MRDEIWYREELLALRLLVEAEIKRTNPTDFNAMVGLGGLHAKLEKQIETASALQECFDVD